MYRATRGRHPVVGFFVLALLLAPLAVSSADPITIVHDPLWSTTSPHNPVVLAGITASEGVLMMEELRVNYQIDDGPVLEAPLRAMDDPEFPDGFRAVMPVDPPAIVRYWIIAEDDLGNVIMDPPGAPAVWHGFVMGNYYVSFEDDAGWFLDDYGTDDATDGVWERAEPAESIAQPGEDRTPSPGELCWVTGAGVDGDPAESHDVDGGQTSLFSPVFDLQGGLRSDVVYWYSFSNDLGANPGQGRWIAQVRNNFGGWMTMQNTTESSDGWTSVHVDLLNLIQEPIDKIEFRFYVIDEGDDSLVEAAVDDVTLMIRLRPSDSPEPLEGPDQYSLRGCRPNPTSASTSIGFQLPAESRAQVGIFDVSGRRIASVADGVFSAGAHTVEWDGRDAGGHPVASGVYYYRLQAGSYDATRPVTISH